MICDVIFSCDRTLKTKLNLDSYTTLTHSTLNEATKVFVFHLKPNHSVLTAIYYSINTSWFIVLMEWYVDIVKPFFFFTDPHKDDLMELFIDADIQHFTQENKVRNLYNASFFLLSSVTLGTSVAD